jgi:hypothetical protein
MQGLSVKPSLRYAPRAREKVYLLLKEKRFGKVQQMKSLPQSVYPTECEEEN